MQHPKRRAALYLIRNDLRLHDNEVCVVNVACPYNKSSSDFSIQTLVQANNHADFLIPLYCFDPRHFSSTHFYHLPQRTGLHRFRFLKESVEDISHSLKEKGSSLLLRVGKPEAIVPSLIESLQQNDRDLEITVYFQREICSEETNVEKALRSNLPQSIQVETYWGHTLFHVEDLPFRSIKQLPDVYVDDLQQKLSPNESLIQFNECRYTQFRTACEKNANVRNTIPIPDRLRPLPAFLSTNDAGRIPSPAELGFKEEENVEMKDARSAFPFKVLIGKKIANSSPFPIFSLPFLLPPPFLLLSSTT